MRYLHTHQRVSLMFLTDTYAAEHRTLTRVDTADNTSDVFTKPMPREGCDRHCALVS